MSDIDLLADNPRIPGWLLQHFNSTCGCGAPLVINNNLTRLYCVNPYCKFHLAKRVEWLAEEFKIEGYGPAKSLDLVERNDMKSHLEAIPVWFREPPTVKLWKVGKYSMIYGYKDKWEELLKGYNTFEEYFASPLVPGIIRSNEKYLLYCQSFFNLKRVNHNVHTMYVWLTGSFSGYVKRDDFIAQLNQEFGDLLYIKDNKKKKGGTQFLIKPKTAADRSKTVDAINLGIPIVTPEEFYQVVHNIYYSLKNL